MMNDEVYAGGLLYKALDPLSQPKAITAYLRAEEAFVREFVQPGARVVDVGCGNGRHLISIHDRMALGVGIDYEQGYIAEAVRAQPAPGVHFLVADATAVPLAGPFDVALCLGSTWGTMGNKMGVLEEIRRLAPSPGTRLVTAYSENSIGPRREWYARLGQEVVDVTDEGLVTQGGFTSEHFTESRIRSLMGPCTLHPIGDIAYVVQV